MKLIVRKSIIPRLSTVTQPLKMCFLPLAQPAKYNQSHHLWCTVRYVNMESLVVVGLFLERFKGIIREHALYELFSSKFFMS